MTVAASATLLAEALPRYDAGEVHSLQIDVPPDSAWDALRAVKPFEVRLLAPLLAVRVLPAALVMHRPRLAYEPSETLLDMLVRNGFVELGTLPGREYAVGAIGRFWRVVGNEPLALASADEFRAFEEPGYAKAVMNFTLEPSYGGTWLRTETRVAGTDPRSALQFGRYWRLIRLGSGLIRISWLNAVRRRAAAL